MIETDSKIVTDKLSDKIGVVKSKIASIKELEKTYGMPTFTKYEVKSYTDMPCYPEPVSEIKNCDYVPTCKMDEPVRVYELAGERVGSLVEKKNAAYGDSFHKCADFLRLLYPNGIASNQYTDMLCIIRIFDKLSRIATDKGAFNESPYQDIAGYALLGLVKDEGKKASEDLMKELGNFAKTTSKFASLVADANPSIPG